MALTLCLGCRKLPRAMPPAAPAQPQATGKPQEPSAPKCESLDAKCTATADTHCSITGSEAWFTPPPGWLYAEESTGAITQASDDLAAMAFAAANSDKPKDVAHTLDALLGRLHVTKVKTKKLEKRLKKPQSTVGAGDVQVRLWEVDKDKQGEPPELDGKKGALLVIVFVPAADRAFVGASFVVKPEAEDRAGAILESVKSLRGSK